MALIVSSSALSVMMMVSILGQQGMRRCTKSSIFSAPIMHVPLRSITFRQSEKQLYTELKTSTVLNLLAYLAKARGVPLNEPVVC